MADHSACGWMYLLFLKHLMWSSTRFSLGSIVENLVYNDPPDVVHTKHYQPMSYQQPNLQCTRCDGLFNNVDDGTYLHPPRPKHAF